MNYTIKCNRKKKRSSYESLVECNHHKNKKPKACFATLAERKTRFYIAVKMPDRRAETMENAIVSALARLPATGERNLRTGARSSSGLAVKYILPIRTVRGKRARMKMQTACFERFIRKRNLSRVAPTTLKRNLALINARPRKVLNFRSAQDFDNSLVRFHVPG